MATKTCETKLPLQCETPAAGRPYLLAFSWLLCACGVATAAEPPSPPAGQPTTQAAPAPKAQPGAASEAAKPDAAADKTDAAAARAQPDTAGKKPTPERFVPSEQVRADFDVSFPIDM